MALTDTKLRSMLRGHDQKSPIKLSDGNGLSVLCRSSGKVSFIFRYRYLGKQKNVTLGEYTNKAGGMTLAEARKKAGELKGSLDKGSEPSHVLRLEKDERLTPVTVKEALEYWIENYAKEHRVNWHRTLTQFKAWIYPEIGDLPVEQCETRHWLNLFDKYKKKAPQGAGYAFQAAKQALKFCRVRRFAISNVLDDLTIKDVAKPQNKKDRFLSMEEVRDVVTWAHDPTQNLYYARLALFLMYTGARTQEIRLSTLNEWDLNNALWTVPKHNSKTNVRIERPIPDVLLPLVKHLSKGKKSDAYLLGELKESPAVAGYAPLISKRLKHERWNWHDFRRTIATHLNDQEVDPFVVESLLGHALQGAMSHYVMSNRLPAKKAALELWSQIIAGNTEDNVLPFKTTH